MAHSSPEPAARWFGGGARGEAGRRAPHAGRAVMAHSSPEPAASLFGGGRVGRGLGGAGPAGWLRESGSRLPQSKGLRPACSEGREGSEK